MGKKMYYSEEEAAAKLTPERLQELIEGKQLRVYPDGAKKMFKAVDVDGLVSQESPEVPLSSSDDADAQLARAGAADIKGQAPDTDAGLELSLEDDTKSGLVLAGSPDDTRSGIDLDGEAVKAGQEPQLELSMEDAGSPGGTDEFAAMPVAGADPNETKETPPELRVDVEGEAGQPVHGEMKQAKAPPGEGMSIFDDDELDIETADPMAKTQVAPSLEDQIALEGVGSGSGLLDLTRESDDTSLGAEVLDHIDMDGIPTALANVPGGQDGDMLPPQAVGMGQTPMTDAAVVTVEAPDPSAGLFGGLATGICLLMLLMAFVFASVAQGVLTGFVEQLNQYVVHVLAGGLLVSAVLGVVGYFVGKSALGKHQAEQKMGGAGR
ncbi:MAG: hypothetical protein HZA50_08790 [Planctomycetes bacterium]|nr:hypothetical protein [Planctomycetota bacterium]